MTEEPENNVRQISGSAGDDMGLLGMKILLGSLSMIFIASLIGYLVIRGAHEGIREQGLSAGVLAGLWGSTIVMLISSGTLHWASNGIREGRIDVLKKGLVLTTILGLLFLALQGFNWFRILQVHPTSTLELPRFEAQVNMARLAFYMLAGLHALHVIGGIIPLLVVTNNAFGGVYSAEKHPGVTYVEMYWHFLDVVWVVLFLVLLLFA
jgi:cytochrome c oxidase subunit 3